MHGRSIRGVFSRAVLVGFALVLAPTGLAAELHGRLDGMRFVGMFGPDGQPGDRKDTLYFGDGQFWSANCVPCGFSPAIYWVRQAGDEIHFRGEMASPERGKFTYTGIIRGKRLTAKIHWRQERWYWSIDRDFRFEGTLSDGAVTESASRAKVRAESAGPKARDQCGVL